MARRLTIICGLFWATVSAGEGMQVSVDTSKLQGPHPLESQTRIAAIRDYLQAWNAMGEAFDRNRPELLDSGFTGVARDKLSGAIQQQTALGVHTRYRNSAHNLQVVFYSSEGLSIQMIDTVQYDMQVSAGKRLVATIPETAHYVVILTPTENRWKVRVLQAVSD